MNFKTGDAVEVCSNDEGFCGAWYEAKIVRSMPRLNRYTVVYDSIVEATEASKNLRETVDDVHVRPRPPLAHEGTFSIQQYVDAFCNDGWWEGVVSGLLGSVRRTKYSVSFPISGDVMEFQPSELRPHLDWVNGEWVNPQTQDVTENMFGKGTSVEVSSDVEGFHGAWFPATVVKSVRNKFLVEYRDLTTDDETEPLKEIVDSLHIRPSPPGIPAPGKFKYLEEVDTYYNDGWWVGVISKVIDDSSYIVYFRTWGQEIEFGHEDLRPHHDWIGGRWFQASQIFDRIGGKKHSTTARSAAAAGWFKGQGMWEASITLFETDIRRRQYHRNYGCALHRSRNIPADAPCNSFSSVSYPSAADGAPSPPPPPLPLTSPP